LRILRDVSVAKVSRFLTEVVSTEGRAAVGPRTELRAYDQGEVMYRVGDPIPGPCFVDSGIVAFYRTDDLRSNECAEFRWPLTACPLTFEEAREWPLAVVALTPVTWGITSFDGYQEIIRQVPHAFTGLVALLARQHYQETCWTSRLNSVRLRPRVRLILHRMTQELGEPNERGVLLDFSVTAGLISLLANANRDEVGRWLRKMTRQGILVREPRRRLLVPDPARLIDVPALRGA
jgi:CRP-like cAMP-binding protein